MNSGVSKPKKVDEDDEEDKVIKVIAEEMKEERENAQELYALLYDINYDIGFCHTEGRVDGNRIENALNKHEELTIESTK